MVHLGVVWYTYGLCGKPWGCVLHTSCSVIPREAVFYTQGHCGTCGGSVIQLGRRDRVIHVGQSCTP